MGSKKGITLIELLAVVCMVAILAAIAIPIYSQYIERARRGEAKVALEQLRAAQEMRRAEKGEYATNIVDLQNTWGVSKKQKYYDFALVNPTITSYTGRAIAQGAQAGDGDLFIDNTGDRWDSKGVHYPSGKWAK